MTRTTLLSSLTILTALTAAPAAAQGDLEARSKEKTVMITVDFTKGQETEYGSGVLLCQQSDRVWVLTANHVFAGKSTDDSWQQIRPRAIARAKIEFLGDVAPPIQAEGDEVRSILTFSTFRGQDLTVVSFPLTQRLPKTATLASAKVGGQEEIATVGFPKGERKWAYATGELLTGKGSAFHYHSAEVAEGFSGGGVFNAAGAVIAINVKKVPGEQTPGGRPGSWYGKALALDSGDILESIDRFVPAQCLDAEMTEVAELTYRRAMREVSIKDWDDAEALMRLATEQKPSEGGSIHLEGMRYTRYLPRYHLGLALYKQGDYSGAIREWERSEAGREIQKDKRYRTMKRLRKKADAQLSQRAQQGTREATAADS